MDGLVIDLAQALTELDTEHRPDPELKGRGGCVMCWPKDGSWPCTTRLIADELRAQAGDLLMPVGWHCKGRFFATECCDNAERIYVVRQGRPPADHGFS